MWMGQSSKSINSTKEKNSGDSQAALSDMQISLS